MMPSSLGLIRSTLNSQRMNDVALGQPSVSQVFGECLFDGGGITGKAFATEIITAVCGAERTAAPGTGMFDIGIVVDLDRIPVNDESLDNIVHGGLQKKGETTPHREKSPVGKETRRSGF